MSDITSSSAIVSADAAPRVTDRAPKESQRPVKTESLRDVSNGAGDLAIQKIEVESALADKAVDVTSVTISPQRLSELVEQLKAALPEQSNSLHFYVDEVLDRPVVTVVDKESGAVIRQLPSEEIIRAAHNIEYMRGILFDDFS